MTFKSSEAISTLPSCADVSSADGPFILHPLLAYWLPLWRLLPPSSSHLLSNLVTYLGQITLKMTLIGLFNGSYFTTYYLILIIKHQLCPL